MKRSLVAASIIGVLIVATAVAEAQASPMAFLKKTQSRLDALAKASASNARLKTEVNKLLDFELMAQRTLDKHWATLSAAQRASFVGAFRSLLEKRYIKGLRKRASYKVVYVKQTQSGAMAKVFTEVKYVQKGRQRSNEILYRMRRARGRWVVFDVITDDVSMERNYRRSFNRIIKKKGFDELVRKLKKKAGP